MKVKLKYGGKEILLSPYNTSTEKDLLLYSTLSDDSSVDDILNILDSNIENNTKLSEDEKFAVLYKLRSISVGETISVKYGCSECGKTIESDINIDNIVQDCKFNHPYYNITEAFSNNTNDYVDFDMEELDVDEYEELEKYINDNKVIFNFNVENKCISCSHINNISLKNKEFLIENMSEDSISNFFKLIADMVFYGSYTKADIDNMLPFERNIYLGLLNQQLEEQNSND